MGLLDGRRSQVWRNVTSQRVKLMAREGVRGTQANGKFGFDLLPQVLRGREVDGGSREGLVNA